jgi:ABC-type antimicrobial peptide transport system permease subunit
VNPLESVQVALRALRSNKMRTGLTMLGIIIGVASVIAMVAIGRGATKRIQATFESMGTNQLVVRAGNPQSGPGRPQAPAGGGPVNSLIPEDATVIAKRFPDTIAAVAQVRRGSADVKLGSKSLNTQLTGASPEYPTVAKWEVETGRFFTEQDEKGRARVAVLGKSVIEKLTDDRETNLVGKEVLVNRVRFSVVGILKEKGVGGFGQDQDDVIMVPCSTALRRVLNRTSLTEIDVMCKTAADMPLATEQIVGLMRERHKLRPPFPDNDDFNVRSLSELSQAMAASSGTMTALLGGIALVSLLVGGIGIMNIMLVSVTERTREIGIRKAVGATGANILTQFLIEALVIALLGGLIGIVLGVAIAEVMGRLLKWSVSIESAPIIISVLVSASVGIFFGINPAMRAANLNPIDALRFE